MYEQLKKGQDAMAVSIKGLETEKQTKARFESLQGTLDEVQQSLTNLSNLCLAQQALIEAQGAMLSVILEAVTLRPATSVVLTWDVEGTTKTGEHLMSKVAMMLTGILTVNLLNKAGGPGIVDGTPSWTASPEGVVTLTPAEDGMSCKVTTLAVDTEKAVVITFTADNDLGDSVTELKGTATLTVFNPDSAAATVDLTVGTFAAETV